MKTLEHHLAVLFWFFVGLFIACGPARATTGTTTGGSGLNLTWTTTATSLTIGGTWHSNYTGDQLYFFMSGYPGHDGGQVGSAGTNNTSTQYTISTTSGSVSVVLYSTNGGTTSTYGTNLGTVSWTYGPESQTCTQSLEVGSDSIQAYHTAVGNAHGAQAGNAYNIAITTGEGSATIDAATGHFSVTAGPHSGTIQYKVWISAGNGYEQSNYAYGSVAVAPQNTVNVNIEANTGDKTIQYDLKQDGIVFATITRPGHSLAYTGTFAVPPDGTGEVTMDQTVLGVKIDGNSYIEDPSSSVKVATKPLTTSNADTPPAPSNTNDVDLPLGTPSTAPVKSSGTGTIWSSGNSSSDPTQQKDLLTNSIFREGIDKLHADNQTNSDRLDDYMKHSGFDKVSIDGLSETNSAIVSVTETAQSFTDNISSKLADTFGSAPAIPNTVVPTAGDDLITLDSAHGLVLHTNPFSGSGPFGGVLGTTAAFIRALISWSIVLAFYIWALKEVNTAAEGFFRAVPFSKSIEDSINSIKLGGFGGGFGYLARTAGLLLLVPVVLTMPLAIMAAATSHLPMASIVAAVASGSPAVPGGMLGDAVALADQVIPWALLMSAPCWYVIAQYGLIPSKFFWMMFAKFIPL